MKKIIFVLTLIILLSACGISALKTGIVIETDSEIYYDCIEVNSGDSVYNVLKNMDNKRDDISMIIDGELTNMYYLRSINGLGPKTEGNKYYGWNFFVTNADNNVFTDPPELVPGWGMGIGDYKITKEENIGIKYSYSTYNPDWSIKEAPKKPKFLSYDQLCGGLKANITKVYVDGEKQKKVSGGGKVKDIPPNSTLRLKIELENLYDSDTDISINDISIEAVIEEIDNGKDIEAEIEDFDLEADKKTTKELEFKIPLEVEAKDRLLRIEIKGKDNAGIKYEKEFRYDLEIEKEEHKLEITKAKLNKDSYKCGENALLELPIINIGLNNEDVNLKIENEDLKLDINEEFRISNNVFKASSKYEKRFNILLPEDIEKATYPITIKVDYRGESETKIVNLVISECEKEIAKEGEKAIDTQTRAIPRGNETKTEKKETEKEVTTIEEIINKNLPLILIFVLALLVALIITLLIIFFVGRR